MLRGLYTAAAGMITQQRKHDTATGNLANLNTPGFKQGVALSRSFPETMIRMMNTGDANNGIGRMHTGVMVEETMFPVLQGELVETGKPTDFAIVSEIQVLREVDGEEVPVPFDASGKFVDEHGEVMYRPQAFFAVWNGQDEMRYTRSGNFHVNAQGELLTMSGHRVLGLDGDPIVLDVPIEEVRVNTQGQLYNPLTGENVVNADGEPIGLLIHQVNNPNRLVREGNSVFRLDNADEEPSVPVENFDEVEVRQGYIERSNVDPIQAMTDMMAALRAYEANQKAVRFYDSTLDKAVNEVGRV